MKQLLSFFKRGINSATATVLSVANKSPVTVAQIHEEFFSSSEKLLNEAKVIISIHIEDERVKKLIAAGFENAPEVIEYNNTKEQLRRAREAMELVEYYRMAYPLYKFITRESIFAICEKYNLYFTDIARFIGNIPDKNLDEIANFNKDSIKEKDRLYEIENMRWQSGGRRLITGEERELRIAYFSENDFEVISKYDQLHIACPITDLQIRPWDRIVGREIIQDPIVFFPVRGGYFILTAWGDEAKDPEILNPIRN